MPPTKLRTVRKIEAYLQESGPSTARQIAVGLGREQDLSTIKKYLAYYPGIFKKRGREGRETIWHM